MLGVPGEPVGVLHEHRGNAAGGDQVPHPVQTRPVQGRPALRGVHDLRENPVARAGGEPAERLQLLRQGVALTRLRRGRDAGVEDGPAVTGARAVAQHPAGSPWPAGSSRGGGVGPSGCPDLPASRARRAAGRRARLVSATVVSFRPWFRPRSVAAPPGLYSCLSPL